MFEGIASTEEVSEIEAIFDGYSDREFMVILDFVSAIKKHSFAAVDVALYNQLEARYNALYECMRDN